MWRRIVRLHRTVRSDSNGGPATKHGPYRDFGWGISRLARYTNAHPSSRRGRTRHFKLASKRLGGNPFLAWIGDRSRQSQNDNFLRWYLRHHCQSENVGHSSWSDAGRNRADFDWV